MEETADQGSGASRPGEGRGRRMPRAERREQILLAATRAFVRVGGFAATGLDDVAAEAGVTRMILYRHFESKAELYRAAIDRAAARLHAAATGSDGELGEGSVPGMLAWAADDPAGFRLLFQHVDREPEFRDQIDHIRSSMVAALCPYLVDEAIDEAWAGWAAHLATTVVVEAIAGWLEVGRPDPDQAVDRIRCAIDGVYQAARRR